MEQKLLEILAAQGSEPFKDMVASLVMASAFGVIVGILFAAGAFYAGLSAYKYERKYNSDDGVFGLTVLSLVLTLLSVAYLYFNLPDLVYPEQVIIKQLLVIGGK